MPRTNAGTMPEIEEISIKDELWRRQLSQKQK
jgi:hypothetical protein